MDATPVTLRYTYRLRPGKQAQRALWDEWCRARWVWNMALERLNVDGEWTHGAAVMRAKNPWLAKGSSIVQNQVLREFCNKRRRGHGWRKFKSGKRDLPSLNYTRNYFSISDGRLRLSKGIVTPVVWSRSLPSQPSSVRIFRDTLGDWYASFVVQRTDRPSSAVTGAVGIDWGVKTLATASESQFDLPHPEHRKRAQANLARYQRMMARRRPKPGHSASGGYKRAKLTVAKQHKKVARQRQDTARKWSRRVVDANQLIAIEDFKPKFLAKSTMARKAADAAIGETKRTLIEYAKRAGRTVVLVDPAYSTMDCSSCGARAKSRLPLSQRVYSCESCGLVEDRDRNAARVILARAGLNPAGADDVSRCTPLGVCDAV